MHGLPEAPEALLAAHDRLRTGGFSIVSLIGARTCLEARIWLSQWASARGRNLVVAPVCEPEAALAAYGVRVPAPVREFSRPPPAPQAPLLLLPGGLPSTLPCAAALIQQERRLPVALACGVAEIVDHLLDPAAPMELVSIALQGLAPIAETEQQVLKTVAQGRRATPFLRGACEGLVYYMLEARQETRGQFLPNQRLPSLQGDRGHEVDIVSPRARLVVEIDGPEHDRPRRRAMDEKKQCELEKQGYRVRRFTNEQVISDPVGVWRLIAEQFLFMTKAK